MSTGFGSEVKDGSIIEDGGIFINKPEGGVIF